MIAFLPVAVSTVWSQSKTRCTSVAVGTHPELPVYSQFALACAWFDEVGHSMSSIGGRSPCWRPPAALSTVRKWFACLMPSMVGSKKWYGLRITPAALEPDQFASNVLCVL